MGDMRYLGIAVLGILLVGCVQFEKTTTEINQIADLEFCQKYFDGCNTCDVKDGKLEECTRKYCREEAPPRCVQRREERIAIKLSFSSSSSNFMVRDMHKELCEKAGGKFSREHHECVDIPEQDCREMRGIYNICASRCRHNPKALNCSSKCEQVCLLRH